MLILPFQPPTYVLYALTPIQPDVLFSIIIKLPFQIKWGFLDFVTPPKKKNSLIYVFNLSLRIFRLMRLSPKNAVPNVYH